MSEESERTENFLNQTKFEMLDVFDRALREISNLGPYELWKARRIADVALGIGPYWDSWRKGPEMWFVRRWRYLMRWLRG